MKRVEITLGRWAILGMVVAMFLFALGVVLTRGMGDPDAESLPGDRAIETVKDDAAASDSEGQATAVLAAMEYFTIDELGRDGWTRRLTAIAEESRAVEILADRVWPSLEGRVDFLAPSKAEAWKVVEGVDPIGNRKWQTWHVIVYGTIAWPRPAPPPAGPFDVPWAENGRTDLLVTLFEQEGHWRLGLFPVATIVQAQVFDRVVVRSGR